MFQGAFKTCIQQHSFMFLWGISYLFHKWLKRPQGKINLSRRDPSSFSLSSRLNPLREAEAAT